MVTEIRWGGPHPLLGSWYAMASYHITNKLTLGSYYSQNRLFPQGAKLEAHYMDGNSIGFYQQVNPDGFQRVTRLMMARASARL